jgi:FkbH-like protein
MTESINVSPAAAPRLAPAPVKCVVWDLDNTLWEGTLLEGDAVRLRPEVIETIHALDARGVLNSIASRNEHADAYRMLARLQVEQYFVAPQISWEPKSAAVSRIAAQLNLGTNTLIFVDDDAYERAEVAAALPEVRCFGADSAARLLELLELRSLDVTGESRARRALYQAEALRRTAEESFSGTSEDFLRSLGMVMTISAATEKDLERAHELTARTSQLNSCGRVYSLAELAAYRLSPQHRLLMVSLDDRYGAYGRIGLALLESSGNFWTLKLLLTSCRVMSRGIGAAVLYYLLHQAKQAAVQFLAEFVQTDRNRIMMVTYGFAGFRKLRQEGELILLGHELADIPPIPTYIKLITE